MEWLIGGLVVAYLLSNSSRDESTDTGDGWRPYRADPYDSYSSSFYDDQDEDDESESDEEQVDDWEDDVESNFDDDWEEDDESNFDDDWEEDDEPVDLEREYDPIAIGHLCTDLPVIVSALAVQPASSELQEFVSSRFAVGNVEWAVPHPRPSDWIWERSIDRNTPSHEAVRETLLENCPRVSLELLVQEGRISEEEYDTAVSGQQKREYVTHLDLAVARQTRITGGFTTLRAAGLLLDGPHPIEDFYMRASDGQYPDVRAFIMAMSRDEGSYLPQLVFADWLDEHGESGWASRLRRNVDRDAAGESRRPLIWEHSVNNHNPSSGPVREALLRSVTPVSLAYLLWTGRISRNEYARATH